MAEKSIEDFKVELKEDACDLEDQTDRAEEAVRFVDEPGGQWESFLTDEFKNRSQLQFDLTSGYINRFLGEWNTNRVGVEFKADGSSTSDDDADFLNGIYRADFRQNFGKQATDNAVNEVVKCGAGAFKMITSFEDEEDPTNELQRIGFEMIVSAYNHVIWDRSARTPDKRKAKHVTELVLMDKKALLADNPGIGTADAYRPESRAWFDIKNDRSVFVANRYEIEAKKERFFVYHNLTLGQVEAYTKEQHDKLKSKFSEDPLMEFSRERMLTRQRVYLSQFTGDDYVKERELVAGKHLPIIQMYGYYSMGTAVERYRGLVEKRMDAQRVFNMQMSQMAENAASSGQDVPIFEPTQMKAQAIKDQWADRNNKAYMLAESIKDKSGNRIHHGPVGYVKPPMLDQNMSTLIGLTSQYIRETTGGMPQETLDPDASGKALNAMIKLVNLDTQPVQENVGASFAWSGVVYQAMANDVYDTPRAMNTISEDNTEGTVNLFEVTMGEKGNFTQKNRLQGKRFKVYPDIGPQYETQEEQEVEDLKGVAELVKGTGAEGEFMPVILASLFQKSRGSMSKALKRKARQMLLAQGLVDPESDEDKEYVAQLQENAQGQPNDELMQAAAEQQRAEARNLDASSVEKTASASLKAAQTEKTLSEIETDRIKTIAEIRREAFKGLQLVQ